MELFTILLTIASILVPVCATIIAAIYTVDNRVKAEHKPYIVLNHINEIDNIDKKLYFIVMIGDRLKRKFVSEKEFISWDDLDWKLTNLDLQEKFNLLLSLRNNFNYGWQYEF